MFCHRLFFKTLASFKNDLKTNIALQNQAKLVCGDKASECFFEAKNILFYAESMLFYAESMLLLGFMCLTLKHC